MFQPSSEELQRGADSLRVAIVKHERGLLSARSPRARLSHQFRLAVFKEMLADVEARLHA
jgi:hypothetical protein